LHPKHGFIRYTHFTVRFDDHREALLLADGSVQISPELSDCCDVWRKPSLA